MKILLVDEKGEQITLGFPYERLVNLTNHTNHNRLRVGDRVKAWFGKGEGTIENIEIDDEFILLFLKDRIGFNE